MIEMPARSSLSINTSVGWSMQEKRWHAVEKAHTVMPEIIATARGPINVSRGFYLHLGRTVSAFSASKKVKRASVLFSDSHLSHRLSIA